MQLNYRGLSDAAGWERAGVRLPKHDWEAMRSETEDKPVWIHFGAGNIFRMFIAGLQQRLLDAGEAKAGIIAVETFDPEVIERIYAPHDSMTLAVTLRADGGIDKAVCASIAEGVPRLLEHSDLRWITRAEIPDYDFCPADEEILRQLMAET